MGYPPRHPRVERPAELEGVGAALHAGGVKGESRHGALGLNNRLSLDHQAGLQQHVARGGARPRRRPAAGAGARLRRRPAARRGLGPRRRLALALLLAAGALRGREGASAKRPIRAGADERARLEAADRPGAQRLRVGARVVQHQAVQPPRAALRRLEQLARARLAQRVAAHVDVRQAGIAPEREREGNGVGAHQPHRRERERDERGVGLDGLGDREGGRVGHAVAREVEPAPATRGPEV